MILIAYSIKNEILTFCCLKTLNYWVSDVSVFYQLNFQEPATITMEGILFFNLHLLFLIIAILIIVGWLIYSILFNFIEFNQSSASNFVHSSTIEIIWTTMPALILLGLASPSFSLLYSLDEISNPSLTLKIFGHQWYWSYELSDFIFCSDINTTLRYSSYMLTDEFLKEQNFLGFFRTLETNKRIVLPTNTHMRLLVTAVDVLHSWTIPSFGIKIDACPGRLNQGSLFIKRIGMFFGQCSEICGVNHGFMPIVILSLPSNQFYLLIFEKIFIKAKTVKEKEEIICSPPSDKSLYYSFYSFEGEDLIDLIGFFIFATFCIYNWKYNNPRFASSKFFYW